MTTMSVTSVIVSGMRKLGIVPEEQEVPPYMVQRGLELLNDILAEWGNDRIYIPYQSKLVVTLEANKGSYTFGNGDEFDVDTNQIISILEMTVQDPNSPGVDYPTIPPITEEMYAAIPYKKSTGLPCEFLLRNHVDYSELLCQPLPYKELTLTMICKQRLSQVAQTDLLTEIPINYARPLKYKLAMDAAQIYGKNLSPGFMQLAIKSLEDLEAAAVDIDYTVRRDEQLNQQNIVYFGWFI